MNSSISKRQARWIENMIEEKKEDDRKSLSEQETILDMFLPVKVGVREHGLTALQIANRLGKGHDYKSLCYVRVQICTLQRSLVCDGIPFACVQDGKYKKYGFTNNREFEEVQYRRKVRMLTEIKAGIKYLSDGDSIKKIGEKFTVECNKQIAYVDEASL